MSETYDSIGNQVIRNFRHYIDAHRHFWLRSEQKFLPPSVYELSDAPQPCTSHASVAMSSSTQQAGVSSTTTSSIVQPSHFNVTSGTTGPCDISTTDEPPIPVFTDSPDPSH